MIKSYILFLLVSFKSINVVKLVRIFCNFQKLKKINQKQICFDNLTLPPSLYDLINSISYKLLFLFGFNTQITFEIIINHMMYNLGY